MADWYTVKGLQPYDGRYELDLEAVPYTLKEWGWIKRYAGYLPATFDMNTFSDPEMVVLHAIIAMHRSGKIDARDVADAWERFADVPPLSVITFEPGPAEDGDADSPPATSSNGKQSSSGDSSMITSAISDIPPSRTGSPASATSVSAPQTSES